MSISSPKTLGISVSLLVLTYFQLSIAIAWQNGPVTRDFNFGPAILIMLGVAQIVVGLTGVALSIRKTTKK
jgi:hypothetical protein